MNRIKFRLLIIAAVAAWFLCPLPSSSVIKTDVVHRQGLPSSAIHDVRFACRRTSDQIEVNVFPSFSQGRLEIDVLDAEGQVLAGPYVVSGDKSGHWTLVTDGGFTQGQTFQLQCREYEVLGPYRLSISQPRVIIVAQRYLAGLVVLIAGLLVTGVFRLLGIGGKRVLILCRVFGGSTFLASLLLVYTVVHEGGHILVLMSMAALDTSRTSVFPVNGQLPHAAAAPSAHLSPFELAAMAIAGPLLPTLLGYGSFAVWRSRFGRRWRAQRLRADIGWSLLTVILLLPEAVTTPLWLARVLPDKDYSLFVQNAGLPLWISSPALAVVALVNSVLAASLVKHFVLRVRTTARASRNGKKADPEPPHD